MFVTFEEMPDHSRVWIYQSDRELSDAEVSSLEEKAEQFLTSWSAHGSQLKSTAKILRNLFLVIMVDEQAAMASGCSIDASVNFVKTMGAHSQVDFFNRTQIAFLENEKIRVEALVDIKNLVSSGVLTPETKVFDNLVPDKVAFDTSWIVPVSDTWMKRYFNKQESL